MTPTNPSRRPLRVNLVSLGCAKNLIDSERMLAVLGQAGMLLVGADDPADATIINTCGFIEDARREAFTAIERALRQKRARRTRRVVVAGCLAQYWGENLRKRYPGIDAIVGLAGRDELAGVVDRVAGNAGATRSRQGRPGETAAADVRLEPFRRQAADDRVRLRLTERCWAYLRISEGCSQGCAFCSIPRIRGPFRSKPPDLVLAEARELLADGAVELNLIGQETTGYGRDIGYRAGLAGLLRRINALPGLRWLRVLYAHPATLSDRHIAALAECDKVVPYLDLPLQHINDRLLRLMNRRLDRAGIEDLLGRLHAAIDKLAIRTTMMVGFPTETEAESAELLEFVRRQRFAALGAFVYSPEPRTAAARLRPAVEEIVARERYEQLLLAQQQIAFDQAQALVGARLDCLVLAELSRPEAHAARLDRRRRWLLARHARQAPEIDGVCYLACPASRSVPLGAIVPAEIIGRRDYDLIGRWVVSRAGRGGASGGRAIIE